MKEAKKGRCQKCKKYFYIHEHHILPKAVFGRGKTAKLCPNCHTHFHEYSKMNTKDKNDIDEAMNVWETWLSKIIVTCAITGMLLLFGALFF